MGYRSQVRSLIYGPPDQLNAMVVKHQLEGGKVFESDWFGPSIRRYKVQRDVPDFTASPVTWNEVEVEVIDLEGDSWKWYESYDDVKAWETFMYSAADFGCSYEFLRIGEEENDIERESNIFDDGENWLGVSSSIYCNIEPPKETDDGR